MPVRNVSHVAIGVRDMDRSVPFWTEVVGLHVSLDAVEEFKIGGELVRRRGVYLREKEGPDEPFIVLDQQLSSVPVGEPKPLFQVGLHHFGFWVDDIDAIHGRAVAAGVPVIVDPTEKVADSAGYGEPPGRPLRAMFVKDPDGNVIQFDQRID
jgi:catechol 2,3-dioxygenase-like lactoylglutathione lyase family enzyme